MIIKASLLGYGLELEQCRGQASDGATVMRGANNKVTTMLKNDYPLAIYRYCSGHGLNLVYQDAVASNSDLQKNQIHIKEIIALIQYCPRRRRIQATGGVLGRREQMLVLEEGHVEVPQSTTNLRPLWASVVEGKANVKGCHNLVKLQYNDDDKTKFQ